MIKYRVTFIYGTWYLWADIERPVISDSDRRGFADLAQVAVNVSLESLPHIEKKYIAHDYVIFELQSLNNGEFDAKVVYSFDTLVNE